ncbi:Lcl domain-containing protein [Methylomagnum sp.]
MKLTNHASAALLLAGLALSTTASAGLFTRPGGMVYDSDLGITWLADANYALTSGYDADGVMNWDAAVAWADQLVYGGYSDWRLPAADPSCGSNANCTGSELGHLFYSELGVMAGDSILNGTDTELAKFTNIQSNMYWSGTEHAVGPSFAWDFSTHYGNQHYLDKGYELYAWAVRPGDVAAAVPEPASLMLLGSGVVAWLGGGWKRRRG